jgi:hypothetical protein
MDLGATTGILGATVPGRALYEALGWQAAGPLSGFVYQRASPPPAESDHPRHRLADPRFGRH